MNFEPQKFFIGLMDFFSILLPGALLTYLLMDEVGPVILGCNRYQDLSDAKGVAAFLVAGYLVGHLVFLLGSWLDLPYDWLRGRSLNKQIIRLAHRGMLSPWFVRAFSWIVFKQEQDLAVICVGKIKAQALKPLQAQYAINTFQWSKALLAKEHPDSLAAVQRFEADSKFFRCFVVVLAVLAMTWPFDDTQRLIGTGILFGLLLLAFWRYMEQRYKATNQAYWAVITLTGNQGKVAFDKALPAADSPTHAGGVVYRMCSGGAEYLLVEAKDDPNQWVLPKGHIEPEENPRVTAVREVYEETGVWARIISTLSDTTWTVDGSVATTRFYLMEAVGRGLRKEKDRRHDWLTLQQAVAKASYVETRELLQAADAQRPRP
ncbi:MAG: NUDIX domain-containing protein [Nitrospira sp.]|jgi:8-oxo-dGTP pyrophosphatase MutT (NUDIX family)|nr:NUDIX domain-containing protein [Nitrospira sp.]MBP6604355.1 NUDIX domain-containing protein [Nitrospira sp.]HQY57232.1 NUDIX domain-containing protein [Nitrospira sp.]